MIEELKVSGFRSLKDVTWRPGRLNVIIGPNGSGKSNLLRVLEMLSESAKGKLDSFIHSEGGFSAILWDGEVDQIHTALRTEQTEERNTASFLEYEIRIANLKKFNRYIVEEENVRQFLTSGKLSGEVWNPLRRDAKFSSLDLEQGAWETEDLPKTETTLSQIMSLMPVSGSVDSVRQLLLGCCVYQGIDTSKNAAIRSSIVSQYEKQISPDGQNLIQVLHTLYSGDREFKETINRVMSAAFEQEFEELTFPPASTRHIQMQLQWKSLKRSHPASDLSDGTLRFLYLVAILANPEPPSIIAIDEPETGLHPSMLPLIAELAANASLRSQVIFTTHSDQFLDAFSEAWEKPTVTLAKWENGETSLSVVDGDELKNWLEDYSLGALYRSGELESGLIG